MVIPFNKVREGVMGKFKMEGRRGVSKKCEGGKGDPHKKYKFGGGGESGGKI